RPEHFSSYLKREEGMGKKGIIDGLLEGVEYKEGLLEELEEKLIRLVLERVRGNKTRAAKILGITKNTLKAKMERYGIR
ncbi:TPA: nitrogen regulation protein NR(I), partial [bacterium]|nr:nitrogen regulation protein NR(I) [bacterium]